MREENRLVDMTPTPTPTDPIEDEDENEEFIAIPVPLPPPAFSLLVLLLLLVLLPILASRTIIGDVFGVSLSFSLSFDRLNVRFVVCV